MMTPADADLTLPSIMAALGDTPAALDLVLTIIFHPDTSRIGYKSMVPLQTEHATLGYWGVIAQPSKAMLVCLRQRLKTVM